MTSPTILLVPGLRDHVETHWQTLLENKRSDTRSVPPLELDKLSRDARVAALDAAIRKINGPIILVAHSAGAMIVAHWARRHHAHIVGAVLATPADMEVPFPAPYPDLATLEQHGWLPIPRAPLPFPSVVVASSNDPLGNLERIMELAHDWDSRLVCAGEVGHLNPAAGYGEWPQAEEFIDAFM